MPDNSLPPKARLETVASFLLWVGVPLMLILPCVFMMHGLKNAETQRRINQNYMRVQATVLSSDVSSWESEHHEKHYDANVKYQYQVNGKTYQGDRLMALIAYGSEGWANSVVSRYKHGQTCDAYYDPANPDKSVLMRAYQFEPYWEMLEAAFVLTGGFFFMTYVWFARKRHVLPADNGWFGLKPEYGERQKLVAAKNCAAMWYLGGAIPTAHFYLCVPPPHSLHSLHVFEMFYAVGLIPVLALIHYWRVNRNTGEAQLLVDQSAGMIGKRIKFSVSQDIRRPLQLKEASVRLLCLGVKRQGKSSSSTTLFEETPAEIKSRALHVGENLELSGELTPPANQQPSGRDRSGKYDWIVWKLIFESDFAHAPDYYVEYRIEVKAPPIEQPEPLVKPAVSADVRPIEPEFAGRIMSRRNRTTGFLLALVPMTVMLTGAGLAVSVLFRLLPDNSGLQPFWDLPKPQARLVFEIGAALFVFGAVWGTLFSGRLGNGYIRMVAIREIKRRPDAIVQPDADSLYVEIIPRENWNRLMQRNSTDIGFLTVDAARREIRFEGDMERYRIPADALLSCEVEKSVLTAAAKPTAPGFYMVVVRAEGASGIWEAPVSPGVRKSAFNQKARLQAANALRKKIKALHPAPFAKKVESNSS